MLISRDSSASESLKSDEILVADSKVGRGLCLSAKKEEKEDGK
jgi:hypothetical protein